MVEVDWQSMGDAPWPTYGAQRSHRVHICAFRHRTKWKDMPVLPDLNLKPAKIPRAWAGRVGEAVVKGYREVDPQRHVNVCLPFHAEENISIGERDVHGLTACVCYADLNQHLPLSVHIDGHLEVDL